MIAHILINPARPVPNETLYGELDRQGIDAKFWEPIHDSDSVVRSINLSHKQIVQFALDQHLLEVCIMEEDVMFPAPDGWQYFQNNKPDAFDLYLGGAYGLNEITFKKIQKANGAIPIHNFAGLHCYIISKDYYAKFLNLPEDKHIDDQPGLGRFFVCAPFAALQHPGWSANNKRIVDYNSDKRILPPECIYYGKNES